MKGSWRDRWVDRDYVVSAISKACLKVGSEILEISEPNSARPAEDPGGKSIMISADTDKCAERIGRLNCEVGSRTCV